MCQNHSSKYRLANSWQRSLNPSHPAVSGDTHRKSLKIKSLLSQPAPLSLRFSSANVLTQNKQTIIENLREAFWQQSKQQHQHTIRESLVFLPKCAARNPNKL